MSVPAATAPHPDARGEHLRTAWVWAGLRLEPLLTRLGGTSGPRAILAVAIGLWVGLFTTHVRWRHDRFGTFDHDLGIWDQAVWLLARGESFITVRGLDVFGFHASPALYLFAPASWLGAGPNLLNATMILALGLGSVAVFLAARHHLEAEWPSLVLALAFLVNFAGQWMMHETFHPEVIAITPLLFAYLAAVRGRWRAFALWLALAVAWKEDVALAGLMLGFLLVVRGTRTVTGRPGPEGTRRAGWWTMAACAAWFVLATQVLVPAFSPEGNFTEGLFGDLGDSPTEIVTTALTDPGVAREHLRVADAPGYVFDLTASFGFTPLLSPLALLIGLPQALVNLLAVYNFFWTPKVHYAALPLAACGIAMVEGVARARRPGLRNFLVGSVAVLAFYTAVSWGISPASPDYRNGYWPLEEGPLQQDLEAAVGLPGPDDSVAATYNLVPHLTHRDEIYTFPNPWVPSNWGVRGENRPDPDTVDWLIIEPNLLNEVDKGFFGAALADPATAYEPGTVLPPVDIVDLASVVDPDEWRVVVARPDLFVAERVRD